MSETDIDSCRPGVRVLAVVAAVAALLLGLATPAEALVNIVYPINGATYPITDPPTGPLKSAYFTASFGVTCGGGAHTVEWGFDSTPVGKASFYDQTSVQLVHKLPGGGHVFWVRSDRACGSSEVKFVIGK